MFEIISKFIEFHYTLIGCFLFVLFLWGDMKTFACRACNKQIGFILSLKSGKRIPVDPESVITSIEYPYKTLITDEGENIIPKVGQKGFIPHWSTCLDRKNFRRSKKRRRIL